MVKKQNECIRRRLGGSKWFRVELEEFSSRNMRNPDSKSTT